MLVPEALRVLEAVVGAAGPTAGGKTAAAGAVAGASGAELARAALSLAGPPPPLRECALFARAPRQLAASGGTRAGRSLGKRGSTRRSSRNSHISRPRHGAAAAVAAAGAAATSSSSCCSSGSSRRSSSTSHSSRRRRRGQRTMRPALKIAPKRRRTSPGRSGSYGRGAGWSSWAELRHGRSRIDRRAHTGEGRRCPPRPRRQPRRSAQPYPLQRRVYTLASSVEKMASRSIRVASNGSSSARGHASHRNAAAAASKPRGAGGS